MKKINKKNQTSFLSSSYILLKITLVLYFLFSFIFFIGCSSGKSSAKKKKKESLQSVYFENIKEGDKISSPFNVIMGAKGLIVEPAGSNNDAGRGHHHILINTPMPTNFSLPIPKDKNHLHFGNGQKETLLELPVGNHQLTLLFANGAHIPYSNLSQTIQIVVTNSDSTSSLATNQ